MIFKLSKAFAELKNNKHLDVKYFLETLDLFITETINPEKNDLSLLSIETIEGLLIIANGNKENSRLLLMNEVFSKDHEHSVELLIKQYQVSLIRLLDILHNYQYSSEIFSTTLKELYSAICLTLEKLLEFIEKYFSKYFDQDQKVPDTYLIMVKKQLNEQSMKLDDLIHEQVPDYILFTVVHSYFSSIYFLKEINLNTYRSLIYHKDLISELKLVLTGNSPFHSLKELLIYFNFNHIEVFKHLIEKLQVGTDKSETSTEKIENLKYERKIIRQINTKPGFSLFMQLPSLKEQTLDWIEEEIKFLQSSTKVTLNMSGIKIDDQEDETKISVALSVAQLAFFIRILNLGKIITNNNHSVIIRNFTSNFRTLRTEDISYGSLYGKYFKPEASTIRDVKDVLLRLVNLINKMKA